MKKYLTLVFLLSLLLFSCKSQELKRISSTITVDTVDECLDAKGYWYKGKCWANFKEMDEGISKNEIDSVVTKQLGLANSAKININGEDYPILFFMSEQDEDSMILITIFKQGEKENSLIQVVNSKDIEDKYFKTKAALIKGNIVKEDKELISIGEGILKVERTNLDSFDFSSKGILKDSTNTQRFSIRYFVNESIMGMGTSTLKVKNHQAYLDGDLGTITYQQIKDLINNHPEVKTIVFGTISGSVNDAVNMHTGRLIREAGITTKVLSNSEIASGGVDLFCAGKNRIITKGAKLGVHSWTDMDFTAKDLPLDHPAHQYQIAYFKMCLAEKGEDFYFYTLDAAPADNIHWMNEDELKEWGLATQFTND